MTIQIEIVPQGAAQAKEKGGWNKLSSPLIGFTSRIKAALCDIGPGDMVRITGIEKPYLHSAKTMTYRACAALGIMAKVIENNGALEVVIP